MTEKPLTVWFAGGVTEAHRTPAEGALLAAALEEEGVTCVEEPSADCDAFFLAAFNPFHLPRVVREAEAEYPGVPVVHYCWDLYPFQVEDPTNAERGLWLEYVDDLKRAVLVVVPSHCTVSRVRQYCGDKVTAVVPTSVRVWGPPEDPPKRLWRYDRYVYNTMRYYATDPNRDLVRETCRALKVEAVEPGGDLPWDDFRRAVLGAAALVSPYYEASTGGLTLLEGYWHGLPLVVADSPRNGVRDYFPAGADLPDEPGVFYFPWDNRWEFRRQLEKAVEFGRVSGAQLEARRLWVRERYSERRMAAGLARAFRAAAATR